MMEIKDAFDTDAPIYLIIDISTNHGYLNYFEINVPKFAFFDNSEVLHNILSKMFPVSSKFGKFPLIKD